MRGVSVHQVVHPDQAVQVDVVFIHGLRGDYQKTWTHEESAEYYWPKWLKAVIGVQVWSVDYPTLITDWSKGTKLTIPQLAGSIAHALVEARGLGKRPIVLVGHSMGGLVIKEIIAQGRFPGHPAWVLRRACAGVVFFGTPHGGADIVQDLTDWSSALFNIVDIEKTHVAELRRNSSYLRSLNRAFGYWLQRANPPRKVVAYRETQNCIGGLVVSLDSADPKLGNLVSVVDLVEDHLTLCKIAKPTDERVCFLQNLCRGLLEADWCDKTDPPLLLLSYHWDDQSSAECAREVAGLLDANGVQVISDLRFRDRHEAPPQGWSAWREKVIAEAASILMIGGPSYLQYAGHEPTIRTSPYQGVVLTEAEAAYKGLAAITPVLFRGVKEATALPDWIRFERYNGLVLPDHAQRLISNLCGTEESLSEQEGA